MQIAADHGQWTKDNTADYGIHSTNITFCFPKFVNHIWDLMNLLFDNAVGGSRAAERQANSAKLVDGKVSKVSNLSVCVQKSYND